MVIQLKKEIEDDEKDESDFIVGIDDGLAFGGWVCNISLEPKIEFHGFKRYELTIETPVEYMEKGGLYAEENIHQE